MSRKGKVIRRLKSAVEYIRVEALGGVVLIGSALLAFIMANSPLHEIYEAFIHLEFGPVSGHFLINDVLMAIFFLVVGLEIKREVLDGELSSFKRAVLPGLAAVGGMIVPALIYVFFNKMEGGNLRGWAIPTATDIAFSLAILALFGRSVPIALKIFLTALAIIDDLLAVLAIALFYTDSVSWVHLGLAAVLIGILAVMNRKGVKSLWFYLVPGLVLFYLVYMSGIHATIAGVMLAMVIPMRAKDEDSDSPLVALENRLHPWVSYLILPLFAFANSGVAVAGFSLGAMRDPVTLGSFLGLFMGKQIGVMSFCWLAIKSKVAELPGGVGWFQLYGVSVLTGVGFTMSLFIGGLAFGGSEHAELAKIGVMAGSLASAVLAGLVFFGQRKSHL
jgi:Na+:H+ antiporter, NhaA family